jgi:hypothetical protein
MLFEKLVQQYRIHRFIAHRVDFASLVAHDQVRINCCASSAINPIQACLSYRSWSERLPGLSARIASLTRSIAAMFVLNRREELIVPSWPAESISTGIASLVGVVTP